MGNKISIIIPAYNAEKEIPDLILSLEKQSVKPFEMILVDDCSTDNTRGKANRYFKVFSTPQNLGPAAARNLGLKKSCGDIIAFLDDDCRPKPDWIEQVERQFENKDIDVVTGGVYVHAKTILGKSIAALGFPGGGSLGFEKMWRVASDGTVNKLCSGNMGIRRKILEKYGYFDESFSYCFEDAALAYSLAIAGVKIYYVPEMDVEHMPMEKFWSFIRWHYARGKGINSFKKKVGTLRDYIDLRLWSTMNIIKTHNKDFKLPLILMLLFLSVFSQQVASMVDKWQKRK